MMAGLIGEIWYERPDKPATTPSLLLKLLFTSEPLSIQVHPDDAYAQSMGLAERQDRSLVCPQRRRRSQGRRRPRPAADAPAIARRPWTTARSRILSCGGPCLPDDVISVPAGTIHAIGAGLVVAEIQQRSDATFRLFDYGRQRELHIDSAIAVADAGPARVRVRPNRLTDERTLLVSGPHFVLERIDLAPNSTWCLEAKRETWLLVLSGDAVAGSFDVATADAVFAQSDRVDIHAGTTGMVGLVAYTGIGPVPHLLRRLAQPGSDGCKTAAGGPGADYPSLEQRRPRPDSRLETTK